jgi:serine/threonine protein kinase/tetratricopeptide (TPR) repeat protein
MKTAGTVCETCGAQIPDDATGQICPACFLEAGIGLLEDDAATGVSSALGATFLVDSVVKSDDTDSNDASRAHVIKKARRAAKVLADFGDYELLEEIGRGGQGVVYRAYQKSLNRTVALKVISLGPWTTDAHLKRFRREAEAAASLEHPGIVPIYEVGERDAQRYFSMKFVEGGHLDEVTGSASADSSRGEREPMSIRRAVELIAKVARTVHYAHEHGILHRDIKPGNILLDDNGEPHLTDFGLARLVETESTITGTREVLGTPSYMAPEQAIGEDRQLTSATDVYGLGAVLYQLLTGQPPFAGGTTYETVKLLLETEPRQPRLLNPKVDRDLSAICLKCLEKDPKRRYSSALALAEDLEHWVKHEPIDAKRSGFFTHSRKWVRRNPAIAALVASLMALAAAIGWNIWKSELIQHPTTAGIAVLPFENLSNDREDAFFADGVQDDLLTKLAYIADLKVISRTSVMQYRSQRNMRQIGNELGVSHVLEGTVRKRGAWVHINAQLIDTRTDSHVWAKQYDGDIKDRFVILSEIAQRVADQLHVKVSSAEKFAIDRPPTADVAAFDFYTRGKNLLLMAPFAASARKNLLQAVDLLNQAVAHDPVFFQAYCQLAYTDARLYGYGIDHTPERLASADAAVQAAFRLRPDSGEAHLARAGTLYQGHRDYDGALAELEVARRSLPNDPQISYLTGCIQRRQGRWEESTRNLERSTDLDPRNVSTLQQLGRSYSMLRRHADQSLVFDRILAIEPNEINSKLLQAEGEIHWKADTKPLHRLIDSIRATNRTSLATVATFSLICALAERDGPAARTALAAIEHSPPLHDEAALFSRPFLEGLIARMTKDEDKARLAFTAARSEQEKVVRAQLNYGPPLCMLGLIDAALGRREEALREGRRAVELLPPERDAINGTAMIAYLAVTAAWTGDNDLACEQLATAIRYPGSPTYGNLKLMPFWDPLRGDPRFEKLVEEAKKPVALKGK